MRGDCMAFITDYQPAKRVGIEELDGCIRMFADKIDEMDENGEADSDYYVGAYLALQCVRYGKYEYPRELMWKFEEALKAIE